MGPTEQLEIENPIAAEAYRELHAEENDLPMPKAKKDETEAPPAKAQKEEEPPVPSKEEEGEQVADPDKAAEEKPAEEAKTDDKKSEEVIPAADAPLTDEVINAYAIKHSITPAEAKEEIQADRAVLKNYKTPEEMARAVRFSRSEADKLKKEVEKKQAKPVFVPLSDEQFKFQATEHITKEKDKHVNKYRKDYPAKSELMTDEAILEDIVDRGLIEYRSYAEKKSTEIIQTARAKKEQLLSAISDDDRKYIPAVKVVLDSTDPRQLLGEGFDIEDLLRHARGEKKNYLAAIKEAEERGYKRGVEAPKILGMKSAGDGKATVKSKTASGLNPKQMEFAASKYQRDTPEESYEWFKDIYADDLKEDPHFCPHS